MADGAALLPTALLAAIADPAEVVRIRRRQAEYLHDLAADITAHGVQEPLILAVDVAGKVCVQNGHHRIIAAVDTGIDRLPVRWAASEGVRMHSVSARELIGPMLASRPRDERLRRAAEFALLAIEDAGERGWALGDAVCALEMALGRDVSADALRRMASIDPCLAEPPG